MRGLLLVLFVSCSRSEQAGEPLDPEGWRAQAERAHPALAPVMDEALDPVGLWWLDWLPGYDRTVLQVDRLEDGALFLRFHGTSCTGRSFGESLAQRVEGVLVLERPVAPFGGETLRRLVPVRIEGRECLVPDHFLASVGRRSPEPPQEPETGWAFVRYDVPEPEGYHERWEALSRQTFQFGTTELHFGTFDMYPPTENEAR